MNIKVSFADRDEVLGAIVRAPALQVAGFQVSKGVFGGREPTTLSFIVIKPA